MEKQPKFIRDFSKENFQSQRDEAAKTAWEQRAEGRKKKKELQAEREELKNQNEEREKEIENEAKRLEELRNQIAELSGSRLENIKNYFKLRKIKADLIIGEMSYEELKELRDSEQVKMTGIEDELSEGEFHDDLKKAKKTIEDFYQRQAEEWAKSEYSKEEVKKYFSEEHLASLTVDEYKLLMERFPGHMVTHVTRQGIRDHTSGEFHTGGVGEYHNGFVEIIGDGRLRSPLGIEMVEDDKQAAVKKYLALDKFQTKEEATEHLDGITLPERQAIPGSYADRSAIHFAAEAVADEYYGAERNNEIFIAYPSLHIASQYFFCGSLNESGDSHKNNDQWVWANEEKGMDVDAGIVFIPADAKVDNNSGSRYQVDEKMQAIKNKEDFNAIKSMVLDDGFVEFVEELEKTRSDILRYSLSNINDESKVDQYKAKYKEEIDQLRPFREKLENVYKIKNERLLDQMLLTKTEDYLGKLAYCKQEDEKNPDADFLTDGIDRFLQNAGVQFKESENTIASKEFWEDYFAKHPDQRPSKIVYYSGGNPSRALNQWRGRSKETDDGALGFPEHYAAKDSEQVADSMGAERFRSIAMGVIEDHFANSEQKLEQKSF